MLRIPLLSDLPALQWEIGITCQRPARVRLDEGRRTDVPGRLSYLAQHKPRLFVPLCRVLGGRALAAVLKAHDKRGINSILMETMMRTGKKGEKKWRRPSVGRRPASRAEDRGGELCAGTSSKGKRDISLGMTLRGTVVAMRCREWQHRGRLASTT